MCHVNLSCLSYTQVQSTKVVFCLGNFMLTASVLIHYFSISSFSDWTRPEGKREKGFWVQVYRIISDVIETQWEKYSQDKQEWTRAKLNQTRSKETQRPEGALDDVCAPQSHPQEEGNHHSSASLLLWTSAEENNQREGENNHQRIKSYKQATKHKWFNIVKFWLKKTETLHKENALLQVLLVLHTYILNKKVLIIMLNDQCQHTNIIWH